MRASRSILRPRPRQLAGGQARPGRRKTRTGFELTEPLVVDSYRQVDLQKGCQLHTWNIRAHGPKKFTTSLLVIRDGKAQTVSKIEYTWGNWDDSQPPAAGQILLLMQDGQIFGVKDKRLPLLAVDFPKLPSHGRMTSTSNTTIDGVLSSIGAMPLQGATALSSPPGKTRKAVLYAGDVRTGPRSRKPNPLLGSGPIDETGPLGPRRGRCYRGRSLAMSLIAGRASSRRCVQEHHFMLYPSAVETQLDSKPQFLSLPSLRITKLSQGNDGRPFSRLYSIRKIMASAS